MLVANPGRHHSYELAFGLNQAGLLEQYVTGFYYKADTLWGRVLNVGSLLVPSNARSRLINRSKEGLPSNRVTTSPLAELLYVSSARVPWLRGYAKNMMEWRNERFDTFVADLVACLEPAAVACYDGCALRTFQCAEHFGTLRWLDQAIGDIRSGLKLLHEEAELSPEFADGEDIVVPQHIVDRCAQETLLADMVLAGSDYVKTTLMAHSVPAQRIRVIPYGVDIKRFTPVRSRAFDRERLRLLFVGQIGLRKGVRYLLEAVRRLRSCDIQLTLLGSIAGNGRGLAPYRDYFRYVPHAPHSEVQRLFQDADVFVFPSLHEGSALSIYEALACGLPVITTPNSGSVVRDGIDGFIVPVRDIDALEEKILLLLHDRDLRAEMATNARRRAEEFTWDAYHQRVGDLFRENPRFVTRGGDATA